MIDVDPEVLVATVDRYNEICDKGVHEDFGKNPKYLHPVKQGPFTATKATCFFFCTSSGVRCNGKLQVCDKDWKPIPHLYAAGDRPRMRNAFALFHGYTAGRFCADENFTWDQVGA